MDVDKLREVDQAKKPDNGIDKKHYTFPIEVEFHGEKLKGSFSNHILTNNERAEVDVIAARMRGGLPWESFSPTARDRQQMIAHLIVSLSDERPAWAKEIGEIEDLNVIGAIYQEVIKHENNFREPRKDS